MTIMEFGKQNPQGLMLLHGGGLSWWHFRDSVNVLSQHFHVLVPILDGHGNSGSDFVSIEECSDRLISHIDTNFNGQITAIAGVSLGGQILVEMLSRRPGICRYALVESALVKPMKLTHALIGPAFGMSYRLIRQKWFSKLQAAYLGIPSHLFDDYYRDTCNISRKNLIAFMKANCAYSLKPSLSRVSASVLITAGSREQKAILDSAKLLHQAIHGSRVNIMPGLRHGELSLCKPEQFTRTIIDLLSETGV